MKPLVSNFREAVQVEREAYERLFKRSEQFRKALNLIACSSHCDYPRESPSPYLIGVADGHRCAAQIAREALNEDKG